MNSFPKPAAEVVISLMKGVLYNDSHPKLWKNLLDDRPHIGEYLAVVGLEVIVDEAEGFAYLRQQDDESGLDPAEQLPRLIHRRPLSYPVSLLCALLRRRMVEQDKTGEETRLIMSRDQIIEMVRVFLPESHNEANLIDQVGRNISKLVEYGFLRKMQDGETYEVRRIIKALVDASWLSDMDKRLEEYRNHATDAV